MPLCTIWNTSTGAELDVLQAQEFLAKSISTGLKAFHWPALQQLIPLQPISAGMLVPVSINGTFNGQWLSAGGMRSGALAGGLQISGGCTDRQPDGQATAQSTDAGPVLCQADPHLHSIPGPPLQWLCMVRTLPVCIVLLILARLPYMWAG